MLARTAHVGQAADGVSDYVVLKRMQPYMSKGGTVTTDNYFTSLLLALLEKKGIDLLGTVNKGRKEIPDEVKASREENQLHCAKMVT